MNIHNDFSLRMPRLKELLIVLFVFAILRPAQGNDGLKFLTSAISEMKESVESALTSDPCSALYKFEFSERPSQRGNETTRTGTLELNVYPDGSLARFEEPQGGIRKVYALNKDYFFSLARATPESGYSVVALDLMSNSSLEALHPYTEPVYLALDLYRIVDKFAWNFFEDLNQAGNEIYDIEMDEPARTCSFRFKLGEGQFMLRTLSGGKIRIAFADNWFIESYELDDTRGYTHQVILQPTSVSTYPVRLVESREKKIITKENKDVIYRHKITRTYPDLRPTSEERCYLSSYGLPEPNISSSWARGFWLLLIGACCVVAAVVLRKFALVGKTSKNFT